MGLEQNSGDINVDLTSIAEVLNKIKAAAASIKDVNFKVGVDDKASAVLASINKKYAEAYNIAKNPAGFNPTEVQAAQKRVAALQANSKTFITNTTQYLGRNVELIAQQLAQHTQDLKEYSTQAKISKDKVLKSEYTKLANTAQAEIAKIQANLEQAQNNYNNFLLSLGAQTKEVKDLLGASAARGKMTRAQTLSYFKNTVGGMSQEQLGGTNINQLLQQMGYAGGSKDVTSATRAELNKLAQQAGVGTNLRTVSTGAGAPVSIQSVVAAVQQAENIAPITGGEKNKLRRLTAAVDESPETKDDGAKRGKYSSFEGIFARTALYTGAATALYGAFNLVTKFKDTMIEMDNQTAQLRKTLALSDSDFGTLVNNATNIARTYRSTTGEVLSAMQEFSGQFKSISDLGSLSKASVIFSNLSGESLGESSKTLISTVEQYGLAVSSVSHITDSWAALSATSAAKINDLGDAVETAGAAAKNSGINFDKFNGIVATMVSSTGQSGKQVGNTLNRMFERVVAPENTKVLDRMGIYTHTKDGEFRNLGSVLDEVAGKWNKYNDTQQKQIAIAFAGSRQYAGFISLMQNYGQVLVNTQTSLNSNGAAELQNLSVTDTFQKKVQLLDNEFGNLARTTSGTVLPALGSVVSMMTSLMRMFNDSPASIKEFGLSLAAVSAIGAGGSFLFKNLFTGSNSAGALKALGGTGLAGKLAENIGQYAIGPTLANPLGAAAGGTAGVSLIAGLGRWATSNTAMGSIFGTGASGYGPTSGALGVGIGSTLTATAAGLATLAVVIGGLIAAFEGAKAAVTAFGNKTEETLDKQKTAVNEAFQKGTIVTQYSASLQDLLTQRKGLSGQDLASFNKTSLFPRLDDIYRNPDTRRLLESAGILPDMRGGFLGASNKNINSLIGGLNLSASGIYNRNIANNGFGNILTGDETNVNGSRFGDQLISAYLGINGNLRGSIQPYNTPRSTAVLGNTRGILGELTKGINAGTITSDNLSESFASIKSNPQSKKIFGDISKGQFEFMFGAAKDLAEEQQTQQQLFDQKVATIINNKKPGEKDSEVKKSLETLYNSWTKNLDQAFGGKKMFSTLTYPTLNADALLANNGGPGGAPFRTRVRPVDLNIDRIDFELQKSLVNNQRLYNALPEENNPITGAMSAVRTAINDLLTNPQKAAGPAETINKIAINERIANLQARLSSANSIPGLSESQKNKNELETGLKIQALKESQSIAPLVGERGDEALRKLKEVYENLENISNEQDSINSGLKAGVQAAMTIFAQYNATMGQTNILGQTGIGTLQAQMMYTNGQLGLQQAMNVRNILELQNQGASPGQIAVQQTTNENAVIAIQNQQRAQQFQAAQASRNANLVNTTLSSIGDSMITKVSGRFIDGLTNGFGDSASSGFMGVLNTLFGQNNPETPVEKNTKALTDLTSAILGTKAGGSIEGAASLFSGKSSGGPSGAGVAIATALGLGVGTTNSLTGSSTGPVVDLSSALSSTSQSINSLDSSISSVNSSTGAGLNLGVNTDLSSQMNSDSTNSSNGSSWSSYLGAIGVGVGEGSSFDKAQNRQGYGGEIGGGLGAAVGTYYGGSTGGAIGGLFGALIGSQFDAPISANTDALNKLPPYIANLTYQIQTMSKNTNTLNQTMADIINAPANFILPIPQGILANSVTAQSALATPLQAGGLILKSGPAYVHAGETVSSGGKNNWGNNTTHNNITINGANKDPQEIANEVLSQLSRTLYKQNQRGGSYSTRFS